jgi:PAS domain S-box-containing protein
MHADGEDERGAVPVVSKQPVKAGTPRDAGADESFRLLFAHNPQPMWVYDLHTLAFLEVNEAAVHQYGYTREEFLAMRLPDIRPTEDEARLLDDVRQPRPAWQDSGEWRHRTKDGRVLDVEITSHTLVFAGRPAALVCAHDVTARKRAEEERQRLLEQAQEALRVRDAFLQAASHDLRTPLTVLSGHADLLRARLSRVGALDRAWLARQTEALCGGAKRLRQIVDELRDMAEVQMDRPLDLRLAPLDVGALVRQVAGAAGMQVDGGEVRVAIADELPIKGDEARLRTILQNVIGNALKFSAAQAPVTVEARAEGASIVIRVHDAGGSRPRAEEHAVFAPFVRRSEASSMSSLDLGWTAAAAIVAQHGGRLRVESDAERGTAVIIVLPRAEPVHGMSAAISHMEAG